MSRVPALRWSALALAFVALPRAAGAQVPPERAAEASVRVHLIPDPRPPGTPELTVGDPFWVTVATRGPAGWYLLPESVAEAFRPHEELAVLGSDRRDGQLRLQLALFRPGDVTLPAARARVVSATGDTLAVPITADTVPVASVLAPGDTLLADIKPLWPEKGVPPWLWIAAAAAAALLLAAWLWRRRRRAPEAARPAAGPDPYLEARCRIEALAGEPPTPELRIAAAEGIGDALRVYLAGAWKLPARERTTLEILALLPEAGATVRGALGAVLSVVDLAKFARVAPDPGGVPDLARRALEALERLNFTRGATARPTPPVVAVREAAS